MVYIRGQLQGSTGCAGLNIVDRLLSASFLYRPNSFEPFQVLLPLIEDAEETQGCLVRLTVAVFAFAFQAPSTCDNYFHDPSPEFRFVPAFILAVFHLASYLALLRFRNVVHGEDGSFSDLEHIFQRELCQLILKFFATFFGVQQAPGFLESS